MSIKSVFLATMNSCKYIFLSGKEANFINGVYYTDVVSEIKELENEIFAGHPHISQSPDLAKRTIDTDTFDPLAAIKAKGVAEYLAAQAAAAADPVTQLQPPANQLDVTEPKRDMGNTMSLDSLKAKLNTANSDTVGAAMAGSSSNAGSATLS